MKRVKSGRNFRRKEPTQKMRESRYDSYHTTKKLSGPTLCTQCGAVFAKGRWSWQEKPVEFGKTVCPACQRIEDQYPAGIIHLNGEFMNSNRKEILQLIRNTERVEKSEHPMERVMAINVNHTFTEVLTTGTHLARRIGKHLQNSYQGELNINFEGENFVRIYWNR
jgi:hypothetical protein